MDDQGVPQTFEERFARSAGMLLRAVERRMVRASLRANALHPDNLGRAPTGDEVAEHERWEELHATYRNAHDGLHKAMVLMRYAEALLRKILVDARGKR